LSFSTALIELIYQFKHGVRQYNEEIGIPDSSINLAIISTDEQGAVKIESSARAMDMQPLQELVKDTEELLSGFGFQTAVKDKYPAWRPEENSFTALVGRHMKALFGNSKTMAIHAGLECGVLLKKYPHIKFASIGPTIKYPHSTREMVNLKSVDDTYAVLCWIVSDLELGVNIDS